MAVRKRTTKKIGPYTKMTTTYSKGGGVTRSISTKPPGSPTRRTSTFNNKTGRSSVTHSTKLGGGWYDVRKKSTTATKKSRSGGGSLFGGSRKRRKSAENTESGDFSFIALFFGLLLIPFYVYLWCWKVNRWLGAVVTVVLYYWISDWNW